MTEEPAFEVVRTYDEFELRRYAPYVVAEVVTTGTFEEAGNTAFRTLFAYLSGQNRSSSKVAMTAPVIQRESQQIAMTAPGQQEETSAGEYAVGFVLPASFTMETAPVPTSPEVRLHQRPAALAAARRYRGRWSGASFDHHCTELRHAMAAAGLTPVGSPRWARFDPPFKPWFLRRNEVLLEVEADPGAPL